MDLPHCRLLPFTTGGGAWQMAADEVLLEAALAGIASLRFYSWSPATLSLGYFQPAAARLADPHWASLPWVRRATGGEALVHDVELTYAVALPPGPPWLRVAMTLAKRMHAIGRDALADLGIAAELAAADRRAGSFLCFLHAAPGDLLVNGAKIAGSAQRKRHGALLQHGGILLSRSSFTPSLPGLAELTGKTLAAAVLADSIATHFEQQTGWALGEADWSAAERERIAELVAARYQSASWNEKR